MNLQLPKDIRWHAEPELCALLGAESEAIGKAIASGRATIIKQGRFRTVYGVHLPNIELYVKHCRPVGWRAWLRECFRPAKAILEFRKLQAAADNGVPTAKALGFAKRNRFLPGESVLITRSIPNAVPCGHYFVETMSQLPKTERTRQRQILAKSLGRFLADLHGASVVHPDLHPDNLLLTWHDDVPAFHLLDLHDVHTGKPCGIRESLRNLAIFNRWFVLRATRSDRLRFWKAYVGRRRELDASDWPNEACRELENFTHASNFRLWRSWMNRCFGNNRRFVRLQDRRIRGHALREVPMDELRPLLADSDAPFGRRPLLKNSRSSSVTELPLPSPLVGEGRGGGTVGHFTPTLTLPHQGEAESFDGGCRIHAPPTLPNNAVYKCFRIGGVRDVLTNLFRRSACLRSWQNGHAFVACLLPTARPLAVWHRHRFGLPGEGYLLTEQIAHAEDLHQFLQRVESCPESEQRLVLRQVIDALGRQIRLLHERAWAHRDLKATNILIQRTSSPLSHSVGEGPGVREKIWFIDLVGAWRPWRLRESRRQKDLSRLNA
ncbi:MAG TPA: lipopolysaccharide kinase InaA family protein, partial [Gemmataceae bacterium]|nr:lipopolysaccharide kinase InaA family protein [Gemmataceae bacterium]